MPIYHLLDHQNPRLHATELLDHPLSAIMPYIFSTQILHPFTSPYFYCASKNLPSWDYLSSWDKSESVLSYPECLWCL